MGHGPRFPVPGDFRSPAPRGAGGPQGLGYRATPASRWPQPQPCHPPGSDVDTRGYTHPQWLCSFVISPLRSFRECFPSSTTSVLTSVMDLWFCFSTSRQSRPEDVPSRSGPWTSSALGALQSGFQSNRPLSLNENSRRPTRKTDPSDLGHVWQGGARLATLSPTALASPNTVSNIASPAQLFCHRRRARSRRRGAVWA